MFAKVEQKIKLGIEPQIIQIADTKCMFSIEQLGKVPPVRKMHVATNTFVQTHLYDSKSQKEIKKIRIEPV